MTSAIDGTQIDRVAQLQRLVRSHKPGDVLDVEVMRFGQKKDFKVKLIEAPPENQQLASNDQDDNDNNGGTQPTSYDKLGISVEPIGAMEGFNPARTITQWTAVKP